MLVKCVQKQYVFGLERVNIIIQFFFFFINFFTLPFCPDKHHYLTQEFMNLEILRITFKKKTILNK